MGVGGNFWDLLKPYARFEGVDFLRDKRVAVDLSFWVVQHDAAIRRKYPGARNPHLRITFFRTLALFAKFGAFPVFVVDGEPSPLKDQARMERFLRGSGLELSVLVKPPEAAAGHAAPAVKQRNRVFSAWVQECVELLEILGMPVLKAQSEAEALCGQLNNEGHVDACITSDSDAFLFGANCVIKCLRSNSKEPFECYYLSDIEAGLGLKRKQMVAIALLVGNDHDLQGVPGFGAETALRFVKLFSDDDILDRLSEVGKGIIPAFLECIEASLDPDTPSPFEGVAARSPHCSQCGHPGNKRAHLKIACEFCIYNGSESCIMKSSGFKCFCSGCSKDRVIKEQMKQENWQFKACQRIAAEHGFPNKEIIEMYLNASSHDNEGSCGQLLRWDKPRVENLVDFLAFHQHWEPSYIRQRILPMLATIFLREMASKPEEGSLLYDQYEFHSIERVKIRYGHPYYLVKWKKAVHGVDYVIRNISSNEELESEPTESTIADESVDSMDGPDAPTILVDDGCWYLVTEENTELVRAAFPKAVEKFLEEKQVKETKSSPRKSSKSKADSESPKSSRVQLSITEFYRSTKPATGAIQAKDKQQDLEAGESGKSRSRPATLDQVIPKSVRRRLLFD